jgi:LysM repeat protein
VTGAPPGRPRRQPRVAKAAFLPHARDAAPAPGTARMNMSFPASHARSSAAHRLAAGALACCCLLLASGCKIRSYESRQRDQENAEAMAYTVVEGDTLSRIAERYRIEIQDIIDANGLKHVDLYVGQRLRLPGAHRPYVYVPKTHSEDTGAMSSDTSWYKPRSTWAVQSIEQGNIFPMGPITRITVHHSADDIDAGGDVVDTLRRIEKQHKLGAGKNEPFACIGYHYVIDASGQVWEGRPIQFQGAHSTGDNNKGNVGICLLGNFDRGRPTPAQRAALTRTLDRLCAQYRVPRSEVYGHNHYKTTDCPGKYLDPIVKAYHDGR